MRFALQMLYRIQVTMNILNEAAQVVEGDRNDYYGDPSIKYRMIAKMWSIIFRTDITPRQVVLAQLAVKLVRETLKHKRDNLVDIAGYARVLQLVTDATDSTYDKTQSR